MTQCIQIDRTVRNLKTKSKVQCVEKISGSASAFLWRSWEVGHKHNITSVRLSFQLQMAEKLMHPASNFMSKVDTWSLFWHTTCPDSIQFIINGTHSSIELVPASVMYSIQSLPSSIPSMCKLKLSYSKPSPHTLNHSGNVMFL